MARNFIVVGASAGGVEALVSLARGLPEDLAAVVFVTLHISPHGTSTLPAILARAGKLPARHAVDGEVFQHGRIYVAPPDFHLLIAGDRVRLTRGPSENGHRPAIDPLFRSAAREHGPSVVGVILSGMLDDGASGLLAIKREGGLALVQSPDEALFAGMPNSAIENVAVDAVLTVAEISALLASGGEASVLPQENAASAVTTNVALQIKENTPKPSTNGEAAARRNGDRNEETLTDDIAAVSMHDRASIDSESRPGAPSTYSCPGCGGVLWELDDDQILRFRCRTGHAYSAASLLAEQVENLDAALWTALRSLEEAASLARRLHERAISRGHHLTAQRFADQAEESDARAEIIRRALQRGPTTSVEDATEAAKAAP